MEQAKQEPAAEQGKHLPDKLWLLSAVIITIAVYIPAINYDFLWDDGYYLAAKHMEFSLANLRYWLVNTAQDLYTPVTLYSLMLDYNLFNDSAAAYHIHNLLLHCGSVIVFTAIMKKLRISVPIAAAVAVLWAVHPQRVPSLVWISERKDVLAVFFAMASFYTYLAACRKKKFSVMSPLFLILSLGAKPAAIGLVIVMPAYTFRHNRRRQEIKFLIPHIVITVLCLLCFFNIHQLGAPISSDADIPQKLWIITHNIMWYLCSGFIPFQLNPVYPRVSPPGGSCLPLVCGFIMLSLFLCLAVSMVKRFSLKLKIRFVIATGLCWGAVFAPVSGIFTIGSTDYCDRYNYLLSAIPWAMLAILLRQTRGKWLENHVLRRLFPASFAFILCFYWYMNWSYMPVWSNCEILFFRAAQWEYPNPKAIENMGIVGIDKNNLKLIELASRKFLFLADPRNKPPFYPEQIKRNIWLHSGWFLRAYAMYLQGDRAGAFPIFVNLQKLAGKKLLSFYEPNRYEEKLFGALASCYLSLNRPREALAALASQLRALEPDSFDALFNQGLTAFIKKDFASAVKYWEAASAIRPEDKKVIYNLDAARKRQSRSGK
ncbi:MAG: hypothetical protein PHV82_04230 [Victivallaceae bacterium]|nr:hypothetical protein [Victivallaceae bacterium]